MMSKLYVSLCNSRLMLYTIYIMKIHIIHTLLILSFITNSCVSKHKQIVVSDTVYSTEIVEENLTEPPPPPRLNYSKILTLKECFSSICEKESPKVTDTLYRLGVYGVNNHFLIFFIDAKLYRKNAEEWPSKKGSDYKDKYYPILNSEFPDKNWKAVFSKIRSSLSEFSKTEEFRKSSLAKIKPLTITFDDAVDLKIN